MTRAPRLLLGAGLGALGGAGFAALHLPLPWLIGALVAVTAARLAGVPADASAVARNLFFGVVGIALGLYFTPATAALMLVNLPLLMLAALATLAVGGVLSGLLARMARVDMATAWFASIPGGAADMAMLAAGYGGKPAPVAVAQLLRVCLVVILTPNLMALSGLHGEHPAIAAVLPFSLPGFLLLYAGGLVVALLTVRLGLRAGWMLGPLAVSAAVTASGITLSGVPWWLSAIAQVALGAQLGAGFDRSTLKRLRRFLPAAVLNVVLLMLGCGLVGVALAAATGESPGVVLLGTAPGGVAEMSLTAKSLGLDVALVVTLHVTRIFLVAVLTPPVFRLLHRRGGPAARRMPAPGE